MHKAIVYILQIVRYVAHFTIAVEYEIRYICMTGIFQFDFGLFKMSKVNVRHIWRFWSNS